jgi:transglutaminase-like putative cysteine protease
MLINISHRTTYRYQEPVKYTAQTLRLTPRREAGQRIVSWSIKAPGRRTEQIDAHGNVTHLLTLEAPHLEISILVCGTVEIARDGSVLPREGPLSPLAYLAPTPLTAASEEIVSLAREHLDARGPLRAKLYDLARGVCEKVRYRPGTTSVDDPAGAALARGVGVCQDQAHVLISCCRSRGVPARYVSGYIGSEQSGDAASHAWVDVWIDEQNGWHGLDVTHMAPVGPSHCRLAVGRDYLDAAPVRGVRRGGGREVLDVSVTANATGVQ